MIKVIQANYANPEHGQAIIMLLDAYARDPMGGGKALSDAVKQNLIPALQKRSDAISLIVYVDDCAAGLLNAFEGFSTFKCKPLINIHDIAVLPDYRGQGIASQLLEGIASIAQQRGCCKLTLEVLEGNAIARAAYQKAGFAGYELDPEVGQALFWEKQI